MDKPFEKTTEFSRRSFDRYHECDPEVIPGQTGLRCSRTASWLTAQIGCPNVKRCGVGGGPGFSGRLSIKSPAVVWMRTKKFLKLSREPSSSHLVEGGTPDGTRNRAWPVLY